MVVKIAKYSEEKLLNADSSGQRHRKIPKFLKKIIKNIVQVVDSGFECMIYYYHNQKKAIFLVDYFTGGYAYQLDAKNRIRIPAKLRGNQDRLYFAKGTGGSIFVLFVDDMNVYLERLKREVKMTDIEKQRGLRLFTHSIKLVEMDQQGRFVVPQDLLDHARITKDVKICGTSDRIEIWDNKNYDIYMFGGSYDDEDYAKYIENYDRLFSSISVI